MATMQRRKLLTGAVGVATVSYVVACGALGSGGETSGNLVAAGGQAGAETSGNLVAAGGYRVDQFAGSGGANAGTTSGYSGAETSGNLVAPPPLGGSGGTEDAGLDDGGLEPVPSEPDSGGDASPGAPDLGVE